MPYANTILPFPRGSTFGDGHCTLSDTIPGRTDLEGRIFYAQDTIHGTGRMVGLRVVKNDAGRAITCTTKFMRFSTATIEDFGGRVDSFAVTAGKGGSKPMDDAYVNEGLATIPDDDLFYVVESGPTYITMNQNNNLSTSVAGEKVQCMGSYGEGGLAAALDTALAWTMTKVASTAATKICCDVIEGLQAPIAEAAS